MSSAEYSSDPILRGGHDIVVPGLPYCSVTYGPLLLALPLEASHNFEYAIKCDPSAFSVETAAVKSPFDWPLDAPVKVQAQVLPFAWNSSFALPRQPIKSTNATGPATTVTLVPYGSAKVYHVSMFPIWEG